MTIQARLSIVIMAAGAIALITAIVVHAHMTHQVQLVIADRARETRTVTGHVFDMRAAVAATHADDYTRWDEFVAFVHHPDPAWGTVDITDNLKTFNLDVAWVLDEAKRPVWYANPKKLKGLETFPIPGDRLRRGLAANPIRHFFVPTTYGPLEVWTSSIVPSADTARLQPPSGYYLVGRLWSAQWLRSTESFVGGNLEILSSRQAHPGATTVGPDGDVTISFPIFAFDGTPLGSIVHRTHYPAAKQMNASLLLMLLFVFVGSLLSLALVWIATTAWVGRPLALIESALRLEDPRRLRPLEDEASQIGRLARLVRDFFVQREDLIRSREKAEEASEAKSRFLASTSHELRTPMHGILSYARFGSRGALVEGRHELLDYFQQIEQCSESLLTMVNSLLDLSKFEAGRMSFHMEDLYLRDVLAVSDEFRPLFHEREIHLEVVTPLDPALLRGDSAKLQQVLRNVLSNAAKFTPPGGHVSVTAAVEGQLLRIAVQDSGIGIPEAELERVFVMFEQASNTALKAAGTGIGLALCREIVAGHGGSIWAESVLGEGTRVTFEIPQEGVGMNRARDPEAPRQVA